MSGTALPYPSVFLHCHQPSVVGPRSDDQLLCEDPAWRTSSAATAGPPTVDLRSALPELSAAGQAVAGVGAEPGAAAGAAPQQQAPAEYLDMAAWLRLSSLPVQVWCWQG